MIGGEEYALSLLQIKEVIEYDIVTKIRDTPEWVRGVVRLRDRVVPVIDLAVKLRLPPIVAGKQTCIVITEIQCGMKATLVGLVADSASDVIGLKEKDIQQCPVFGTHVDVDYLLGMAHLSKKFCLLLDTSKLLSNDESVQLSNCLELCQNLQPDELSTDKVNGATANTRGAGK